MITNNMDREEMAKHIGHHLSFVFDDDHIDLRLVCKDCNNCIIGWAPPTVDKQQHYVKAADQQYGHEGEIEIDEDAAISTGFDEGAYVNAWVWVYNEVVRKLELEEIKDNLERKVIDG